MNERIRELAEQAFFDESTSLPSTKMYTFSEHKMKKFVELIVRQCGYYADIFEAVGCPDDMDPTETKPSDYIKKHFGVEE